MKVKQIKSQSAPERVVKQFLTKIENGEMKAGQKLPTQEQLSELFGVGRSSIREAMNALAIMGYVDIVQGKGSFIIKKLQGNNAGSELSDYFKDANMINLLEIREVLECYAVKKASNVVSEENILILKKVVKRLENSANDSMEFLFADMEFHTAIGVSANLPEIGNLVKSIHRNANKKLPVIFSAHRRDKIEKSIDTAKQILQYIISGEGRRAARCMKNHLRTVSDSFKDESLQKRFEEEY